MPLQWNSEATLARREMLTLAATLPVLALTACSRRDTAQVAVTRLRRLARRKLPPQPGDWLETHQEPGQTYQQFRQAVKTPAIQTYSTLRIVPIGMPTRAWKSAGSEVVVDAGAGPGERSRDLEAVARKHGFLKTATGFAAQSAALSR